MQTPLLRDDERDITNNASRGTRTVLADSLGMMKKLGIGSVTLVTLFVAACGPANAGAPGSSAVTHPNITGTVFTIVFENHDQSTVLQSPYFHELSQTYGNANAYVVNTHPSLPNYIMLTSGSTNGIASDNDPATSIQIPGTQNLADQLDAAGIKWRAYMESMDQPCMTTQPAEAAAGEYSVHHDPFVYYQTMVSDPARCNDRVVGLEDNFANDLALGTYKFMWITPNDCNDMHDCPPATADAWLKQELAVIMASPGYQNGGVVFIIGDEGAFRALGSAADVPAIVVSPKIISPGYQSNTAFDHRSYLATVEDIFSLPRLPTTVDATPMSEFFAP